MAIMPARHPFCRRLCAGLRIHSRRLAFAITVTGAATGSALAAQEPVHHAMVARIREEGLERSRALDMFEHLTNVIGARLTASPAYEAAAEWARDRLTEWGAADARLEPFEFGRGWSLEKLTLEMTSPRYFPLIGYAEAWTPSTPGELAGTPIYVGDRTAKQIQAMGDRLRGTIVLPVAPQMQFITEDRPQPADTDQRVRIGAPRTLRADAPMPARELNALLQRQGAPGPCSGRVRGSTARCSC